MPEATGLLLNAAADPNDECLYFPTQTTVCGSRPHSTLSSWGRTASTTLNDTTRTLRWRCDARPEHAWTLSMMGGGARPSSSLFGTSGADGYLCAAQADVNFAAPAGDEDCGNTALQKAAWKGGRGYGATAPRDGGRSRPRRRRRRPHCLGRRNVGGRRHNIEKRTIVRGRTSTRVASRRSRSP